MYKVLCEHIFHFSGRYFKSCIHFLWSYHSTGLYSLGKNSVTAKCVGLKVLRILP